MVAWSVGAAFLFLKDKTIDTVEEFIGKSIAVLEYDSARQHGLPRGHVPVMSDITNFSTRFNNALSISASAGDVSALELYKGMALDGGILDYAGQLYAQVILKDKFRGFWRTVRAFMFSQLDRAMKLIDNASGEIDDKYGSAFPMPTAVTTK